MNSFLLLWNHLQILEITRYCRIIVFFCILFTKKSVVQITLIKANVPRNGRKESRQIWRNLYQRDVWAHQVRPHSHRRMMMDHPACFVLVHSPSSRRQIWGHCNSLTLRSFIVRKQTKKCFVFLLLIFNALFKRHDYYKLHIHLFKLFIWMRKWDTYFVIKK